MVGAGNFWVGITVLAFSILGGGFGMDWRLGALAARVKSIEDALKPNGLHEFRVDVDRRLRRLETHAGFWGRSTD